MKASGDRLIRLAQLEAILFFSGAITGYALLDRRTFPKLQHAAIMLGPVASATLLFAAALALGARLVPSGRFSFPSNLTIPIVFTVLVRASVILWASPQNAAFRTADPVMPVLIWTRLPVLAALLGLQIVILTIWVVAGKRGE